MKHLSLFSAALFLFVAGCGTMPAASDPPETVLVAYHAKAGKEAALEDALGRTWKILREDKLVRAHPHVVWREKDEAGRTRFVESFTWVSHAAPDNAPANVRGAWSELEALCEPRDGKRGIDFNEVETVVPR